MKKVIMIGQEPKEESKGVEFTHSLRGDYGWKKARYTPRDIEVKIVYLGYCKVDGDMFAGYFDNGNIAIYKGNLNNGTY